MASLAPRAAAIDGVAISLSGLCLIHCLVLPIASAMLPIAGSWAEIEWIHKAFVVAALPFSLLALTSGRTTGLIGGLIASGFILLAAAAFAEPLHDYETGLTLFGGLLLASGHAWRWGRAHSAAQS